MDKEKREAYIALVTVCVTVTIDSCLEEYESIDMSLCDIAAVALSFVKDYPPDALEGDEIKDKVTEYTVRYFMNRVAKMN